MIMINFIKKVLNITSKGLTNGGRIKMLIGDIEEFSIVSECYIISSWTWLSLLNGTYCADFLGFILQIYML